MGEASESKDLTPHEAAQDTNNKGNGKTQPWHSAPFDDEGITISGAFAQQIGFVRALILDHIFFTFVHHYDSPHVFRGPHPDHPSGPERTWIYFTLSNFVRHIGLAESNIRAHLKALTEDGWIERFHEPGKRTYFRPNLERFFNSSHYRAKVRRLDREPDFPGGATPPPPAPMPPPPESGGPTLETPLESGGVPPSNQAGYPHRIRRGSHILKERLKEPSIEEPRAHAGARETANETESECYKPKHPTFPVSKPEPQGTPFDVDESASDEQTRERHKHVLLCALLDGLSAPLIRRRAAEWGFDIDDLVKEASVIASKRAAKDSETNRMDDDLRTGEKAGHVSEIRVA